MSSCHQMCKPHRKMIRGPEMRPGETTHCQPMRSAIPTEWTASMRKRRLQSPRRGTGSTQSMSNSLRTKSSQKIATTITTRTSNSWLFRAWNYSRFKMHLLSNWLSGRALIHIHSTRIIAPWFKSEQEIVLCTRAWQTYRTVPAIDSTWSEGLLRPRITPTAILSISRRKMDYSKMIMEPRLTSVNRP